jgi:hypothetical protein
MTMYLPSRGNPAARRAIAEPPRRRRLGGPDQPQWQQPPADPPRSEPPSSDPPRSELPPSDPPRQDPPRQEPPPVYHQPPPPLTAVPVAPLSLNFRFDGGAASLIGVKILGAIVTFCTLGICLPWALVMRYRWQTKHTYVNGYRLRFTGSAPGLFGHWVKWLVLIIITFGIYSFWVEPRLTRWIVEHQAVDERIPPTTVLVPVDY